MGILSSMYTGYSGIQGQGEALSVYGDNIANSATIGFKTARPEFIDAVAKSMNGMGSNTVSGRGAKLGNIRTVFAQGTMTQTESPTDLAITGSGFFVVDGKEGRAFTRDGSFHFDKEGKLVNSMNEQVVGFQADLEGKVNSVLGPLSIDHAILDAKNTNKVDLFANLDSRAPSAVKFNPKNPDKTSQFATGVTIYDSNGAPHAITVYFNKTDENQWEYHAMARGEEIDGGKPGELIEQGSGKLVFGDKGRLKEYSGESSFTFNNGSKPDQKVEFDFGKALSSGGDGLQITQYGSASEAYRTIQNGYTSGTIASFKFEDDGSLKAVYSNGETISVGQVAVAKFESPEELMKIGGNKFKETRNSGQATIGTPMTGGRGQISSRTLEASTTDIASEFINLMTAQRNFQANSKVISTGDELLGEIINLKRT